jgi:hypothetical protein
MSTAEYRLAQSVPVVPLGRIPIDETPLLLIVSATDFPQAALGFRRALLKAGCILMWMGNFQSPAEFRNCTKAISKPRYV